MSSRNIEHKGTIVSVSPEVTVVRIVSESACAACHAKSLCSVSESSIKLLELPTTELNLAPGEEVTVMMEATMGHKAVAFGYVLPLVVLMSAILVLTLCGQTELVTGLGAIAAVVCYYIALWFMKPLLQDSYEFKIK